MKEMDEVDKLTDFERVEYYHKLYLSKRNMVIVCSILFLLIGFFIGMYVHYELTAPK